MGNTGDPPVPVGDPPTGRSRRLLSKDPSLLGPGALPVPPGESPGGTGQWPVLPENEFADTLLNSLAQSEYPASWLTPAQILQRLPQVGAFGLPIGEALLVFLEHWRRHFLDKSGVVQLLLRLHDFRFDFFQLFREARLLGGHVDQPLSGQIQLAKRGVGREGALFWLVIRIDFKC